MISCVFFGNLYLENRVPTDFFEFVKNRIDLEIFGSTSGMIIPEHVRASRRISYEKMRSSIGRYDFCLSLGNLCELQIPSKIADLDQLGVKTVHIFFTPNDPVLELPSLANFIYVDNQDLLAKPRAVMERIEMLVRSERQTAVCELLTKKHVVQQYVSELSCLIDSK
jgi:hypothetical protein